jgi:hypothetical protein
MAHDLGSTVGGNPDAWLADTLADHDRRLGDLERAAGSRLGIPQPASTLGTVIGRVELFDPQGVSLGFLPLYDTIT